MAKFDPSTAAPEASDDKPPTQGGFDASTASEVTARRGPISEIANQLKAGVVSDLPLMAGQALQYSSDKGRPIYEIGKRIADAAKARGQQEDLQPDEDGHGTVVNALASGARMLPQSVVPAAVVGGALAALPIAPAAAVGGAAVLGALPAAMSQGQQTLDKAEEAGVPREQAVEAARKTAAIEGGGEAIGTIAGAKLLGLAGKPISAMVGKALGHGATTPAAAALEEATSRAAVKPWLHHLPEAALTEVGTEMGQNAGEAYVEQQAGIDKQTPWEAAQQAIGPTLGMTALLAPFGLAGHVMRGNQIGRRADMLASATADPAQRAQAARDIQAIIADADPQAAANFGQHVQAAIAGKQALAITPDLLQPRAPTLALGHTPDPLLSFPDGTVARRSEVEAYLATLSEPEAAAFRAKLQGLAPQQAGLSTTTATGAGTAGAGAVAPAAPDLTTSPGAAPQRQGIDFSRDIDTSGMGLVDPAEVARQRAATIDWERQDTTPNWETAAGAAPPATGLELPPREFDTGHLAIATAAAQGGPISRAALLALPPPGTVLPGQTIAVDAKANAGTSQQQDLRHGAPAQPLPQGDWRNAARPNPNAGPISRAAGHAPLSAAPAPAQVTANTQAAAAPALQRGDFVVDDHFAGAHQAATSPLNGHAEPSDAQKGAENYKVGRTRVDGMAVSVENPQGSVRSGTDENGKPWEQVMQDHYGRLPGTVAADSTKKRKQGLDVFIKRGTPKNWKGPVFVINQVNPQTGKFDEHKLVFGATDEADAEAVYRRNYEAGWNGLGSITRVPPQAFKAWAYDKKRKSQPLGDLSGWKKDARPAPVQAPAAPAAPQATPATTFQPETAEVDHVATGPVGRDGTPISAGGKPFAQKAAAAAFQKKNLPDHRLVEVEGGFVLRPKTDAEIAAGREAGQRRQQAARAASYEANPFLTFLATHGLYHEKDKPRSQKKEFSPDRFIMVGGYGPVFRRTGVLPDALVQPAIEEGYLPQGADERRLEDLIHRAIRGERVVPQYAEGAIEREMERRQQQPAEEGDWAEGLTDEDMQAVGFADFDADMQARIRTLIEQAEAAGVDAEGILEDVAKKTQNASQQDYHDAALQALNAAIPAAQPGEGSDRAELGSAAPGAQGAEQGEGQASAQAVAPEQDLAGDKPNASQQAAATTRAEQEAEQRRREQAAPPPEEFVLSGSTRPADEAAARGQQDLLSQPEEVTNPPAAAPTSSQTAAVPSDEARSESGESRQPSQAARSQPRNTINFARPIAGPSGSALTSYTWQWKPIAIVDKTGEDRVKRISDWDQSATNAETGRDVVHQFTVRAPDGTEQTVSLESALKLLGFDKKVAPGVKPVQSLVSAAKTLARLRMQLAETEDMHAAAAKDLSEVRALALPDITGPDEKGWYSMGDARVRQTEPGPMRDERRRALTDHWRDNRMHDRGWGLGDHSRLESMLPDLRRRIERAEKKLADLTPIAQPAEPQENAAAQNSIVAAPSQGEGSQQASATPPTAPSAQAPSADDTTSGKADNPRPGGNPDETAPNAAIPAAQKIEDLGEKIGGARKDTAISTGRSSKRATEDDRPAWAKRFQILQVVRPGGQINEVKDEGRWIIRDSRSLDWMKQPRQVGRQSFATQEEAEAFLPLAAVSLKHRAVPTSDGKYEIWRDITDRKRVKVVDRTFDSRDDAMAYMAQHATEILETSTTFGEADLPAPPDRARTGPQRREGNVKGEDFRSTFGFRGVEFGNWNNQEERQGLMNDAYDGLLDLADVLGVPPQALGLNGELALAFGARGQGLNSARAHYEHERAVINLTKENGAGSLAHEWFHALDHYFGRQDGKASSQWEVKPDGTRTLAARGPEHDMASHGFRLRGSGVREEVRQAYERLVQTIFKKATKYVEDTEKADRFTASTKEDLARELNSLRAELAAQKDPKYYKTKNKPATAEQLAQFDAIAKRMVDGEAQAIQTDWKTLEGAGKKLASRWTNDSLEQLSAIYKAVRGRSGFDSTNRSGLMDRLRSTMERYSQRLKQLADAQQGAEKTRMVPTEFAMNARELDQGRGTDYWTTPHEMAARAFQGYVEDKVAEAGGVSRFLNYAPERAGILTPWGVKRPYPAGEERKAINKAIDAFVRTLRTKETDQGIALHAQDEPARDRLSDTTPGGLTLGQVRERIAAQRGTMSQQQAQAVVDRLTAGWQGGFQVKVVPTSADLPGRQTNARGRYANGVGYIVADKHRTAQDVGRTLAHEVLAHHGIRAALGKERWLQLMQQIKAAARAGNKDVLAARDIVRRAYRRPDGSYMFDTRPELESDEVAARLIEASVDETGEMKPSLRWLKWVWAKLADFLRKAGLNIPFTTAELHGIFVDSRKNLEEGGRPLPASMAGAAAARDSRDAQKEILGRLLANAPEPSDARDSAQRDVYRMPLEQALAQAKQLAPRVLAAYEKGDAELAERLDARLESLYRRLEDGYSEWEEEVLSPSVVSDAALFDSLAKTEGQQGDVEADLVRDLANRYLQLTTGFEAQSTTEAERAALLRATVEDYAFRHGGLRPGLTNAEIVEAAKDAVAAVYPKRAAPGGPESMDARDVSRADLQRQLRELGLPASGKTADMADMVRVATADPRTWSREDFARIAPHLSMHQMLRDPTDAEVRDVLQNGLTKGMVDSVGAFVNGQWTWAKSLSGVPTAVFVSGKLKYASSTSPWLAAGNKPLFMIRPDKGEDLYDAIRRTAQSAQDSFSGPEMDARDPVIAGDTGRAYTPEQIAAMKHVGFATTPQPLAERAKALWANAGKALAQGMVDQFMPIKEISKEAYGLLRLAKGAAGAFEVLLQGGQLKINDGAYDFDATKAGGVVQRLLVPLQGEHHDFLRWVAANRAEQLAAQDREHLFTPADIAALKTLADGQMQADYTLQHGPRAGQTTRSRAEAYRDSLATFNEFNKNTLDMAQESGLIDGAARHLWERAFYVPFYRVTDDGGLRGMNIKSGVVRQQAFKSLKGGSQQLNADLLENTLMNWAHLLDAAAKNRAAKATLEALGRMGSAIEADEETARQMARSMGKADGAVWFMDEGKKRHFLVDDPYLMTAVSALEFAGMRSPVMNALGAFKHALTVGVTASPFFKVRNLIRDSLQAIASGPLSYNPAQNIAQGWKATRHDSADYFRLLAGGGTIHFGTMMEGSEARRVQALVESGVDQASILDSGDKVKAFYRKVIEPAITAYNELGNRGEAINRAALYQQLTAQGMGHAEASLQARDLMDFSMQGSWNTVRFLTQVVPFFNARIQGLYKLGRAAAEDPARFSAVLGAVSLMSIGLLAAYGDDDDWKKREDADRNNFWWFKAGGTAYRIPKPFEIGAMATLAERSWELAFQKEMTGERFRNQVLALLGDNLSLNPIPQLVKPILEVYANQDMFTQRPIETLGMEKLQPDYRFNANTSMAARAASTSVNAVTQPVGISGPSPVQVDHLVRGYFGWLGSMVVTAGDAIARPATDQPSRPQPDYWRTLSGSMVASLPEAPSRYVSAAYQEAKQLEQIYGTWRHLVQQGKVEEAQAFRGEYAQELARYRNVQAVKQAEAALNELKRKVEASSASPEEKRARLLEIDQRRDTMARRLAPT